MFILVPLTLILTSVVGISVIIFRKMTYLNKLTPETHLRGNFLSDLLPELSGGFESLKLKEYGDLWLIELEKFLRKLRVVSLKIDRISDSWIKKIRKDNVSSVTTPSAIEKSDFLEAPILKIQPAPKITLEDMKREEQRLIIEIAKNPKDFKLYETLGDIYLKMSNFADAKESLEASIELNPHNEELKKKLSQVVEKLIQ